MQEDNLWQCRWSSTLGALEATHQEIWGTKDWYLENHLNEVETSLKPTVFFGLYGLPDFYTLWRHQGRKCILWAGTDLIHFKNGYWLDDKGDIRLTSVGTQGGIAAWIDTYCESYVENEVEQQLLASMGIRSKVVPSFLGDVNKFQVSFKPGNKLYTSVSGDDFKRYGWDKIKDLAWKNPNIEFHLYGNEITWSPAMGPDMILTNIKIHGRVPKEQMNEEIKEMQGALRLTEFDGFSEIVAKSLLMGQYPVSIINYPTTLNLSDIGQITSKTEPNLKGREWVLNNVNKYPWNV